MRLRQDRSDDVVEGEMGRKSRVYSVLDEQERRMRRRDTIDANEGMTCLIRKVNEDTPCSSSARLRSEHEEEREEAEPRIVKNNLGSNGAAGAGNGEKSAPMRDTRIPRRCIAPPLQSGQVVHDVMASVNEGWGWEDCSQKLDCERANMRDEHSGKFDGSGCSENAIVEPEDAACREDQ